jgi:hypothetical protein
LTINPCSGPGAAQYVAGPGRLCRARVGTGRV